MPFCRWLFPLLAVSALGQEAVPFPPERVDPWTPAWELTLRADRFSDPVNTGDSFRRMAAQLRLRWTWELDSVRFVASTRSAVGTDGNQFNAARWDQQDSNGTQADVLRGEVSWVSPGAFSSLSLGLQENGLLVSQALWDRDLRFVGAAGMAGFRSADGLVQEAGFRVAAGRVRNVLGGRMDLAAGQAVLKLDTGSWSWTAHAGRWQLAWDSGIERLRRVPRHGSTERQQLSMDAFGAGVRWHTVVPLEAKWFESRNRESGESSEEVQLLVGSRERRHWPQLSYTWQRLSSTGTLYPVNGDEWWFYRRAQGHRVELAVPLQDQWSVSLVYLDQRSEGDPYHVTRKLLTLTRRF